MPCFSCIKSVGYTVVRALDAGLLALTAANNSRRVSFDSLFGGRAIAALCLGVDLTLGDRLKLSILRTQLNTDDLPTTPNIASSARSSAFNA